MNNPLLSICIPTYNRCDILNDTLNTLFLNPEFDKNRIEVIVSDNCSTDGTRQIVERYPLVRYFRNDENIRDKNFSKCLSYAKGDYIRLFNDTLTFKPGALKRMLQRIEENINSEKNLFFYANMFVNKNCVIEVFSKIEFLKQVSFYSTWIGNFGTWRKSFETLSDKDRYAELLFVQVDWSYRLVEQGKSTIIYFDDMVEVVVPKNKGGYNIFDTFINKYLGIIKREKISILGYEREKYRLLRYFVYDWFVRLFITYCEPYNFNTKGTMGIIFRKYWYESYFYPMIVLFLIKKIMK